MDNTMHRLNRKIGRTLCWLRAGGAGGGLAVVAGPAGRALLGKPGDGRASYLQTTFGCVGALLLGLATLSQASAADSAGEGYTVHPDFYLPEPGRTYNFMVQYADGDSGAMTMVPEPNESGGILICHQRAYSNLYQEFIDSTVQYQLLPDGVYRLESLSSGPPELWLPAELIPGVAWQTESASHRIVATAVPCPLRQLSGDTCLQVESRYASAGGLTMENFFREGYGLVFSRIGAAGTIEFELTGVEEPVPVFHQSADQERTTAEGRHE